MPPTNVTITSSDITETGFRLNVTGEDEQSGIFKYEIYIDNVLVSTKITSEILEYIDITDKISLTDYNIYVKIYDNSGNSKQSTNLIVKTATTIGELLEGTTIRYNSNGATREYKVLYDGHEDVISNKVEIVSVNSVCNVTLTGKNGYLNGVQILNNKAIKEQKQ